MGQNNRQHRAAKAKRRHQREATHARPRPAPEANAHFRDPSRSLFAAEQRRKQALDALSELARRASFVSPDTLVYAVRRTLTTLDPAVLLEVESLLVAELMARISAAWEGGWEPRDLHHLAGQRTKRQGVLAATLITQHARVTDAQRLAPQAWRDQLEAICRTGPGSSAPLEGWRPVASLVATGFAEDAAWAEVLGLLKTLAELPALPPLQPPPSKWDGRVQPQKSTGAPDRDRVLAKIRALLAKAEATNHPAEAETFTSKAQELMSRHAIDEALVQAHDDEPVDVLTCRVHLDSPYASTKLSLLSAVARANRARAIYLEAAALACVVGTPTDVDQVELLFTSLLIQATRAMAAAGRHRAGSFDRSPTFRRSFLTAYAYRIGERLTEADRETTDSYGAELVPVLRRQATAVDAEFDRLFPVTGSLNTGTLDARGWAAGCEAADHAVFVAGRLDG